MRTYRVGLSHASVPAMECHAVDTGVTASLATQRSNRRTGMSSRTSECVHCENRPNAAVNAQSGVTKYFADTRGESASQRRPVNPSPRTPLSTIHEGDRRQTSSTYKAADAGD